MTYGTQRGHLHPGSAAFIFFPTIIYNDVVCNEKKEKPLDSEDWKVEMLRLFSAIFQLAESCVECGRQTGGQGGGGGGFLTFFLQHNNLY